MATISSRYNIFSPLTCSVAMVMFFCVCRIQIVVRLQKLKRRKVSMLWSILYQLSCHLLEFNDSELSSRDTEGEDASEVGIIYMCNLLLLLYMV